MPTVFLDHQSSTPVLPEVLEAMMPYFSQFYGNPSSLHRHGLKAREALTTARAQFAELINAETPETIVFTSGGTESANLAIQGVARANERRGNHIVLSAVEHPAVENSVAFLQRQGFTASRVPVDEEGWVNPAAIDAALTDRTVLICVQHVNHDVGTVQSIRALGDLASQRNIPFFVDAVASAGWLAMDVQALGISLLSLAPHRFYGPKGVGVLYRNRRVRLAGLLQGGDQEAGLRAGTENVPSIVGGGVAAKLASRDLRQRTTHTANLQHRLWTGLKGAISHVRLNGPVPGPKRISTNLNLSAEFTEGEGQLLSLDMAGVAVASGTSCVSRSVKASPVLRAMGLDPGLALASVIITLGFENTEAEVDFTIGAYAKVIERLRGMSPSWDDFQRGVSDSVRTPRAATNSGNGIQERPIAKR